MPSKENDRYMTDFLANMEMSHDVQKSDIDTPILRKFLAYAKQNINPKFTREALSEIQEFYIKLRNKSNDVTGKKSVPVNLRVFKAMCRLAEASAKSRLSKTVTIQDARRSIELMYYCMSQIGIDPKTGEIDMDRIETGMSSSDRSQILDIKKIINNMTDKSGNLIPIQDIIEEADAYGIDENGVENSIEKAETIGRHIRAKAWLHPKNIREYRNSPGIPVCLTLFHDGQSRNSGIYKYSEGKYPLKRGPAGFTDAD